MKKHPKDNNVAKHLFFISSKTLVIPFFWSLKKKSKGDSWLQVAFSEETKLLSVGKKWRVTGTLISVKMKEITHTHGNEHWWVKSLMGNSI